MSKALDPLTDYLPRPGDDALPPRPMVRSLGELVPEALAFAIREGERRWAGLVEPERFEMSEAWQELALLRDFVRKRWPGLLSPVQHGGGAHRPHKARGCAR
jgi:hypothetical protein